MRISEIFLLFMVCLLFALEKPLSEWRAPMQKQEASPIEPMPEEGFYRVIYRTKSLHEAAIADIVWLKKASEVALEKGLPYFDVVESNVSDDYVKKVKARLPVVEGVIHLKEDPMTSQYDANEILNLNVMDL